MTWTAAIIVSAKRADLVRDVILPAVAATGPDQLLIVGEHLHTDGLWGFFFVPAMTHTTNDALVKRDVAALACTSEWIAYFSDDHKPAEDFGKQLRALTTWMPGGPSSEVNTIAQRPDVYVPARYAGQPGAHYGERLNNGEASEYIPNVDQSIGHYCGGHAGVYRLSLIQRMPWTAGPHHREWDLLQSRRHMEAGAKYCWTDQLKVFDVEPNARPWE